MAMARIVQSTVARTTTNCGSAMAQQWPHCEPLLSHSDVKKSPPSPCEKSAWPPVVIAIGLLANHAIVAVCWMLSALSLGYRWCVLESIPDIQPKSKDDSETISTVQ